jgi:uncharacterized protein
MNRKPLFCIVVLLLFSGPVNGETLSRFQAAMIEAGKGNPEAQNKVGTYYKIGIGTDQNDAEAVIWYRKAADLGHAEAQFNLGEMYEEGKGVAANIDMALTWYKKACENGWKCGCRNYLKLMEDKGGCN